MRRKTSFSRIQFFIAAAILVSACGMRETRTSYPFTTLDGQTLDSSRWDGKVMVVDFWATWCNPCLSEIPAYNEINAKFQGRDFKFVGMALDDEDPATIRKTIDKYGIQYDIVVGNQETIDFFGKLRAFPTTYVLNKKHKVVRAIEGARPGKNKEIIRLIEELLNE